MNFDLENAYVAASQISDYLGDYSTLKDMLPVKAGLVDEKDYFNSGAMIFNLKKLRHDKIDHVSEGEKIYKRNPEFPSADQDVFNVLSAKNCPRFDSKFNLNVNPQREQRIAELKPAIYHYVDRCLNLDTSDPYNRLFFEHYTKTPFFNLDAFARLYDKINQSLDDSRMTLIRHSIFSANKKRLFVIYKDDASRIGKIFRTNDNDMMIAVDRKASTLEVAKALINYLNQHRNEFFTIIALGYNRYSSESASISGDVIYPMRQSGFEYGRDYVFDIDMLPRQFGGVFEKSFYYVNPL